jgi:hypothetical protein
LGAPAPNGTVGLNNQNNYCADNLFEPIPSAWGNDQGVWYTFIAPPSGKVEVRLDNQGLFSTDNIDLQVAVYDSLPKLDLNIKELVFFGMKQWRLNVLSLGENIGLWLMEKVL